MRTTTLLLFRLLFAPYVKSGELQFFFFFRGLLLIFTLANGRHPFACFFQCFLFCRYEQAFLSVRQPYIQVRVLLTLPLLRRVSSSLPSPPLPSFISMTHLLAYRRC